MLLNYWFEMQDSLVLWSHEYELLHADLSNRAAQMPNRLDGRLHVVG